jgi:apolipoprotein D and lipocalin family protein
MIFNCCAPSATHIPVVTQFEKLRYLGTWYEVARLDHSFERGLQCVIATYSTLSDGKIKVVNSGITKPGKQKSATEKAYVIEQPEKPGALKVSFFGPFYADYRIIYLTPSYAPAVVSGSRKTYLSILNRTPELDSLQLKKLLNFCDSLGFETDRLIFPRQTNCSFRN